MISKICKILFIFIIVFQKFDETSECIKEYENYDDCLNKCENYCAPYRQLIIFGETVNENQLFCFDPNDKSCVRYGALSQDRQTCLCEYKYPGMDDAIPFFTENGRFTVAACKELCESFIIYSLNRGLVTVTRSSQLTQIQQAIGACGETNICDCKYNPIVYE